MNILEFVEMGGLVRTASGHNVDAYLSDDEDYPIYGTVLHFGSIDYNVECKWDKNGMPHNPVTNHGLALNPLVREVKYHMVSRQELEKYSSIPEFQQEELNKIRQGRNDRW